MENKSIAKKIQSISFACGIITMLIAIFSATNIISLWGGINKADALIKDVFIELDAVEEKMQTIDSDVYQSFLTNSIEEKNKKIEEVSEYISDIENVIENKKGSKKNVFSDTEVASVSEKVKNDFYNLKSSLEDIINNYSKDDSRWSLYHKQYKEQVKPTIDSFLKNLSTLKDKKNEKLSINIRRLTIIAFASIIFEIVAFSVFIVISGKVRKKVTKSLLDPIEEVNNAIKNLSNGNFSVQLNYQSEDEIGIICDDIRDSFEKLNYSIQYITNSLNTIASGDLTQDYTKELPGDLNAIVKSIKSLNSDFSNTLSDMQRQSMQIAAGASQVANGSQDLAESTTEQAESLDTLQKLSDEVEDYVRETEENIRTEKESLEKLIMTMKQSSGEIENLKTSMQDITMASKDIQGISDQMGDIANQINLLALNASIEAARAGEAGKGFAVVAGEIGQLANQSAEAVNNTRESLEKSIRYAENGSSAVTGIIGAFEEVTSNVETIETEMEQLVSVSEKQIMAIKHMDDRIKGIADNTQSNSANSQESAAISEELNASIDNINELIQSFKI